MSDPRFRPQDFAKTPATFGKDRALEWKSLEEISLTLQTEANEVTRTNAAAALLRAAQFQHYYSVAIRLQIQTQRMTLKSYAAEAGLKYGRLASVLRGQAIMRLEDIAMADVIVGDVSPFAVATSRAERSSPESAAIAQQRRKAELRRLRDLD